MTRRPLSRSVRRRLGLAVAGLGLSGVTLLLLPREVPPVEVTVDGRSVEAPGPHPTVQVALAAAGRRPRDGVLRSAGTATVLDAHAHRSAVVVDGAGATLSMRLAAGDTVTVTDGTDSVEPTVDRQATVLPPPGPPVESFLWYPGAPGLEEQTVGAVSGEVVSARRLAEPMAPRRETAQVVALTFDDGPDPTWTPQVLQILADEGVHATFCLVGDMVRKRPEMTRSIVDQGHTLCTHTMNHPAHLDQLPPDQAEQEIAGGLDLLTRTTGRPVALFRAPAGHTNQGVLDVAHNHGLRVLDWTIDAEGSEHRSAEELLKRIQDHLKPGAVILLHDGGGNRDTTVAVLRPLIDSLRGAGWQFATPTSPPPPTPPPATPPPPVPPPAG